MKEKDGVEISDRASWEHSIQELLAILVKRAIALPSKMLGFKPFCLYLATWLLARGLIGQWIWFAVLAVVLFGIMGLRLVTRWRPEGREE